MKHKRLLTLCLTLVMLLSTLPFASAAEGRRLADSPDAGLRRIYRHRRHHLRGGGGHLLQGGSDGLAWTAAISCPSRD